MHFSIKIPKLLHSDERAKFELAIDSIYLLNVFITPFLAINIKKMDRKIRKAVYAKGERIKFGGSETRVRVLLLNYANYFLMLDLLPSIVGIITGNKAFDYHEIGDVCYAVKLLRFFTLIRLME